MAHLWPNSTLLSGCLQTQLLLLAGRSQFKVFSSHSTAVLLCSCRHPTRRRHHYHQRPARPAQWSSYRETRRAMRRCAQAGNGGLHVRLAMGARTRFFTKSAAIGIMGRIHRRGWAYRFRSARGVLPLGLVAVYKRHKGTGHGSCLSTQTCTQVLTSFPTISIILMLPADALQRMRALVVRLHSLLQSTAPAPARLALYCLGESLPTVREAVAHCVIHSLRSGSSFGAFLHRGAFAVPG